jgi:AraC-like DNA-binding protein
MHCIRQHTRHVAPSERAAHWAEINRRHFGHLDVDAMDVGLDEAELDCFLVDDLRIYRIQVPAHRVSRSARHDQDDLDDCYKLLLQLRGQGRIRQGARQFDLRPDDWSLYDPRQPYAIDNHARTSLLAVQIPRQRLRGLGVSELHTCESPTHGGVGLAAVLGSFLKSMSEQLPSLPDDAGAALAETVLGLLSATLARRQAEALEHATLPAVLNARVRQYVQTHWADPDLDIARIAAAMRCSKRHLYRAFDDESATLDRYIWKTRLHQARQQLQDGHGGQRPIGSLAQACGFRSAAHFSRMFKAEFGLSPRGVRAAAPPAPHSSADCCSPSLSSISSSSVA